MTRVRRRKVVSPKRRGQRKEDITWLRQDHGGDIVVSHPNWNIGHREYLELTFEETRGKSLQKDPLCQVSLCQTTTPRFIRGLMLTRPCPSPTQLQSYNPEVTVKSTGQLPPICQTHA